MSSSRTLNTTKILIFSFSCSHISGLSSSNQKWCRAQAAQSAHQHYLTGQIVHHSSQYHCGVVDCWDRKSKIQTVTVSTDEVTKIWFFCCFQIERVCVFYCVLYMTLYGEQGHMGGRWCHRSVKHSKDTMWWIIIIYYIIMLFSAQSGPERRQKHGLKAWLCIFLHSRVPAELLHGSVLGEAAVVHRSVTEAPGEGHQKPRPLQSPQ